MTGPEHYRRAEELLANIPSITDHHAMGGVEQEPTYIESMHLPAVAVAQVHATLAAAAATALGEAPAETRAWTEVAGTRLGDLG